MKFYDSIGPNPKLVRMFAAEKGFAFPEVVKVDLMAGANRQAPYLEKNPAGQLPCLELDDGLVISETVAICEYLEELKPRPPLIGSRPGAARRDAHVAAAGRVEGDPAPRRRLPLRGGPRSSSRTGCARSRRRRPA